MEPECGFVFAATGAGYVALARRAAMTLKAACPGFPIDLFTDQAVDDPVFDRVIPVGRVWHRPKIEALRRSRFDRTVCLDADLFVMADISDIFTVLDRFDIAAAQDQGRNAPTTRAIWRVAIPPAFPQVNTGVIGLRKSAGTDALLDAWDAAMQDSASATDQPILRELLYQSDLRLAVLPPEYNLMWFEQAKAWHSSQTAPRIIHSQELHRHLTSDQPQIMSLEELVGAGFLLHLEKLAKGDHTLNPGNSEPWVRPFFKLTPPPAKARTTGGRFRRFLRNPMSVFGTKR